MNPEIPTVPNPLSSARIVSRRTPNKIYREYGSVREDGSPVRRGDKDFVMSRSELWEFNKCPVRWLRGYREDGDNSTEWGTLVDSAVFGVDGVEVCPEKYQPSDAKKEPQPWTRQSKTCRDWEDERENAGIVVAGAREWKRVQAALVAIYHFLGANTWNAEDVQVMLVSEYQDKETGLKITLKHLADWLPVDQRAVYDLKTGKSANPMAFANSVGSLGYHWQSIMEMDAANLACPNADYVEFWEIVSENFAPFHVEKIMLSQEWLDIGRLQYASALRKYARCLETNEWPGYSSDDQFRGGHICHPRPHHLT